MLNRGAPPSRRLGLEIKVLDAFTASKCATSKLTRRVSNFPRKREIRVFSASLAYASGFHLSRKSNIAQRQNAQARVSDACLTSHPEPCSMETRPRQRWRATHAQHLTPSPTQWKPERVSEGERRMPNISPRTPLNGNPNASARASDACPISLPESTRNYACSAILQLSYSAIPRIFGPGLPSRIRSPLLGSPRQTATEYFLVQPTSFPASDQNAL